MKYKKSAFTLIELLVVIVIIGILSGIGISTYNDYKEKARMAKIQSFDVQENKKLLAKVVSGGDVDYKFNEISNSLNSLVDNGFYDFYNRVESSDDSPYSGVSSLHFEKDRLTGNLSTKFPRNEFTISLFFKALDTHHDILTLRGPSGNTINIGSNPTVSIVRGKNNQYTLGRNTS